VVEGIGVTLGWDFPDSVSGSVETIAA